MIHPSTRSERTVRRKGGEGEMKEFCFFFQHVSLEPQSEDVEVNQRPWLDYVLEKLKIAPQIDDKIMWYEFFLYCQQILYYYLHLVSIVHLKTKF